MILPEFIVETTRKEYKPSELYVGMKGVIGILHQKEKFYDVFEITNLNLDDGTVELNSSVTFYIYSFMRRISGIVVKNVE